MDIIIAILATCVFVFAGIIGAAACDHREGKPIAIGALCVMGAMVALLVWDYCACKSHMSNPANTTYISCPILVVYDTPFYKDENGKPHEITGDAKFADPATSEMCIATLKGGWSYGMYVTEVRRVELRKKEGTVEK